MFGLISVRRPFTNAIDINTKLIVSAIQVKLINYCVNQGKQFIDRRDASFKL